jgi:hypothetical protein
VKCPKCGKSAEGTSDTALGYCESCYRIRSPHSKYEELVPALTALFESVAQAKHDFCGEQREFHLPRLNKVFLTLVAIFPGQAADAMRLAKDPWGNPL